MLPFSTDQSLPEVLFCRDPFLSIEVEFFYYKLFFKNGEGEEGTGEVSVWRDFSLSIMVIV